MTLRSYALLSFTDTSTIHAYTHAHTHTHTHTHTQVTILDDSTSVRSLREVMSFQAKLTGISLPDFVKDMFEPFRGAMADVFSVSVSQVCILLGYSSFRMHMYVCIYVYIYTHTHIYTYLAAMAEGFSVSVSQVCIYACVCTHACMYGSGSDVYVIQAV